MSYDINLNPKFCLIGQLSPRLFDIYYAMRASTRVHACFSSHSSALFFKIYNTLGCVCYVYAIRLRTPCKSFHVKTRADYAFDYVFNPVSFLVVT